MADLVDDPTYTAAVHEIGTGEAVLGGDGAPANLPHKQMNDRIVYLKQEQDTLKEQVTGLIINSPTTITVGASGQDFTTLQAAWDSLIGAVISAQVTISIQDGTYAQSIITLANQPYAQLIRIEGNLATPSNVDFNFIPSAGKSHGILFDGVIGVEIAGFKLSGVIGETNQLLRLLGGTTIKADPGSIVLDTADIGLNVANGFADFQSMVMTGLQRSIYAQFSSHIDARNCVTTGNGTGLPNFGFRAINGAFIDAQDTVVSATYAGYSAVNNGTIHTEGAVSQNNSIGFWGTGGVIVGGDMTATNNTLIGFRADRGGVINGTDQGNGAASATNSVLSPSVGFSADLHGAIYAQSSEAINHAKGYEARKLSFIDADQTNANLGNNTLDYTTDGTVEANSLEVVALQDGGIIQHDKP